MAKKETFEMDFSRALQQLGALNKSVIETKEQITALKKAMSESQGDDAKTDRLSKQMALLDIEIEKVNDAYEEQKQLIDRIVGAMDKRTKAYREAKKMLEDFNNASKQQAEAERLIKQAEADRRAFEKQAAKERREERQREIDDAKKQAEIERNIKLGRKNAEEAAKANEQSNKQGIDRINSESESKILKIQERSSSNRYLSNDKENQLIEKQNELNKRRVELLERERKIKEEIAKRPILTDKQEADNAKALIAVQKELIAIREEQIRVLRKQQEEAVRAIEQENKHGINRINNESEAKVLDVKADGQSMRFAEKDKEIQLVIKLNELQREREILLEKERKIKEEIAKHPVLTAKQEEDNARALNEVSKQLVANNEKQIQLNQKIREEQKRSADSAKQKAEKTRKEAEETQKLNQKKKEEAAARRKSTNTIYEGIKASKQEYNTNLEVQRAIDKLKAALTQLSRNGKETSKTHAELTLRLRELQKQLNGVNGTVQKSGSIWSNFGERVKSVGANFIAWRGVNGVISSVFGTFKQWFGINTEFEQQMARVRAISGATAEEFKALSAQAKELGEKTVFTSVQVASLQEELSKLGFTAEEIKQVTPSILKFSQATGGDLAESAKVAGAALRVYGASMVETNKYVSLMADVTTKSGIRFEDLSTIIGNVAPVARAAGLSFQELVSIIGVLETNGIKANVASTGLKNTLIDFAGINKNAGKYLGFQVKDFDSLIKALKKIKDDGLDIASVTKISDTRAMRVLTALKDNVDQILELNKQLDNSEEKLDEMADIMSNTMQGAIMRLKSAWDGFLLALDGAMPIFRSILGILSTILNTIGNAIMSTDSLIAKMKAASAAKDYDIDSGKVSDDINKRVEMSLKGTSADINDYTEADEYRALKLFMEENGYTVMGYALGPWDNLPKAKKASYFKAVIRHRKLSDFAKRDVEDARRANKQFDKLSDEQKIAELLRIHIINKRKDLWKGIEDDAIKNAEDFMDVASYQTGKANWKQYHVSGFEAASRWLWNLGKNLVGDKNDNEERAQDMFDQAARAKAMQSVYDALMRYTEYEIEDITQPDFDNHKSKRDPREDLARQINERMLKEHQALIKAEEESEIDSYWKRYRAATKAYQETIGKLGKDLLVDKIMGGKDENGNLTMDKDAIFANKNLKKVFDELPDDIKKNWELARKYMVEQIEATRKIAKEKMHQFEMDEMKRRDEMDSKIMTADLNTLQAMMNHITIYENELGEAARAFSEKMDGIFIDNATFAEKLNFYKDTLYKEYTDILDLKNSIEKASFDMQLIGMDYDQGVFGSAYDESNVKAWENAKIYEFNKSLQLKEEALKERKKEALAAENDAMAESIQIELDEIENAKEKQKEIYENMYMYIVALAKKSHLQIAQNELDIAKKTNSDILAIRRQREELTRAIAEGKSLNEKWEVPKLVTNLELAQQELTRLLEIYNRRDGESESDYSNRLAENGYEGAEGILRLETDVQRAKNNVIRAEDEMKRASYELGESIRSAFADIVGAINDMMSSISDYYGTMMEANERMYERHKISYGEMKRRNRDLEQQQKRMAIAQVWLNYAVSMSQAISGAIKSSLELSGPLAIFTMAGFIAQMVATTVSAFMQTFSALNKANQYAVGGDIVGEGTGTSDSIIARVSNGESVNTAATTAMYAPLLSALNQSTGGAPINGNQRAGGIESGQKMLSMAFAEGVKSMPNPVVSVQEINTVGNRVRVLENLGR